MSQVLELNCEEWRNVAEQYPEEMGVVVEMIIDAEEEICTEAA
ncbi:MAG: hypothetical protein ACWA5X_03745 [bacterium]